MKYLFPILCLSLLFSLASAQIPNAGFETWANGSPTGWSVNNASGLTTITQVSPAHSGSSALRGQVISIAGIVPLAPLLTAGTNARGFATNQRPAALTGYYQFVPTAGSADQFQVNLIFTKGSNPQLGIGVGSMLLTASTSFKPFSVPVLFSSGDAPDTCYLTMTITNTTAGLPTVGSYFILDDLAFSSSSTDVTVGGAVPEGFALGQNYPNPFNPSTAISYQLAGVGAVKLTVLNTLGQVVGTLVDGIQGAGRHTVRWDAAGQPSGVYYYRLQAGAVSETKKMILLR